MLTIKACHWLIFLRSLCFSFSWVRVVRKGSPIERVGDSFGSRVFSSSLRDFLKPARPAFAPNHPSQLLLHNNVLLIHNVAAQILGINAGQPRPRPRAHDCAFTQRNRANRATHGQPKPTNQPNKNQTMNGRTETQRRSPPRPPRSDGKHATEITL